MLDKKRFWDGLEYCLGMFTILALLSYLQIYMSFELHDPDIWLHLKTGEYIVQHKTVPRIDTFSAVVSGKEWIDHSWLVQVIYYLVFHFLGVNNLIFLSAIIVTLAFLILFFTVYRKRCHLPLITPALLLIMLASVTRFNIRPENFSLLFFSLYLFLLNRHASTKRIFLLPLIQLLWVNCHGFYILGPLLVAIFIAVEKLKNTFVLPWEWSRTAPSDVQSYKNLKKVFLLVCLASFFNPYGYKGAIYPAWVIFSSAGNSSVFYNYINELKPTWFAFKNFLFYFLLIDASLAVFVLHFKRINLTHFMLWLIFLVLSLRINRNVIFFNFIAFLGITEGLTKELDAERIILANSLRNFLGKTKQPLRILILSWIIFYAFTKGNAMLNSGYYIFEQDRTKSSFFGIAAKGYPEKAADFIQKNDLPNNIFNLFNYGSYLIYRLSPGKKVFIDGRTELYGGDFFQDYQRIQNGNKDAITPLFARYKINTVLLAGMPLDIKGITRYFYNSSDWVLVYFDADSLIFLKNTLQNKEWINKFKVDIKHWGVTKIDIKKFGLKSVTPEPYINRAWRLYYLGLEEQAVAEAKEILRILPSNPDAYNIIGRFYLKKGLCDEAFKNLRLAFIYGRNNAETLMSLGRFYMKTDKTNDAINAYKKLAKFNPYSMEAYYLLSHAYAKAENIKLAIQSLQKAIKLNPYQSYCYKELAGLFYREKNPQAAIQLYKKAVSLGLDTKDFYENLKQ